MLKFASGGLGRYGHAALMPDILSLPRAVLSAAEGPFGVRMRPRSGDSRGAIASRCGVAQALAPKNASAFPPLHLLLLTRRPPLHAPVPQPTELPEPEKGDPDRVCLSRSPAIRFSSALAPKWSNPAPAWPGHPERRKTLSVDPEILEGLRRYIDSEEEVLLNRESDGGADNASPERQREQLDAAQARGDEQLRELRERLRVQEEDLERLRTMPLEDSDENFDVEALEASCEADCGRLRAEVASMEAALEKLRKRRGKLAEAAAAGGAERAGGGGEAAPKPPSPAELHDKLLRQAWRLHVCRLVTPLDSDALVMMGLAGAAPFVATPDDTHNLTLQLLRVCADEVRSARARAALIIHSEVQSSLALRSYGVGPCVLKSQEAWGLWHSMHEAMSGLKSLQECRTLESRCMKALVSS